MNKKETVINYIKNQIKNNIWNPASPIPSNKKLACMLNVSEITVKGAVSFLKEENILYTVRGSGTFIKKNINNENRKILILLNYYSKLDFHKTLNVLLEKTINIIKEKNLDYCIYIDSDGEDINKLLRKEKNIAGCISLSGSRITLEKLTKYRVPVVEAYTAIPDCFATVKYDYIKMHNMLYKMIKKYNIRNMLIFSHFSSVHQIHPIKTLLYGINEFYRQYNIHLMTPYQNIELQQRIFKSAMRKLKNVPDAIVFFDENIYRTFMPLFPKYDSILKQTKIITHTSGYMEINKNYPTCEMCFDQDKTAEESVKLLLKLMNKEYTDKYIVTIPPVIKNKEIFEK